MEGMMVFPARTALRWGLRRGFVGWAAAALAVYLYGALMGGVGALMVPGYPLHPTNSIGSVASIFEHNLVVLAVISSGPVTLGLTSAALLFMNGTILGFVTVELVQGRQALMLLTAVGPQLPFELGAYVIGAGAALRLGWSFWWPLLSRRARGPIWWKGWLLAQGAAVVLLFAGAVVEVGLSHI
jgi:uncharacterized membrane protein SpoIIM required for sporulation